MLKRIINLFFKGGDAYAHIKPSNKERSEKRNMYYLMDLERTLENGIPCFWKKNRHGYAYTIEEAGLFSKELAEQIIKSDLDNRTIKIHINTVAEILSFEYERT